MRRVSSRQRLFSWDQFDASAPDSEIDDSDTSSQADSDYKSCISYGYLSSFGHGQGHGHASNNNTNNAGKLAAADINAAVDSLRRSSLESDGFGFGPSRSSSLLSLKHFSAHTSFDDIDSEYEYDVNYSYGDAAGEKGRCQYSQIKDLNKKDLKITTHMPMPASEIPSLTSDLNVVDQRMTSGNIVSPSTTYQHRNKKRNLDGMKKSVSFSNLLVSSAAEISTGTQQKMRTDSLKNYAASDRLLQMQQDAQIHCLSFLELDDLHNLSSTCKYFSGLLIASEPKADEKNEHLAANDDMDMNMVIRNVVWWNLIRRKWSNLHLADTTTSCNAIDDTELTPASIQFVDNKNNNMGEGNQTCVNYSKLLSLSRPSPSTIDSRYLSTDVSPNVSPSHRISMRMQLFGHPSMSNLGDIRQGQGQENPATPTRRTLFRKFTTCINTQGTKVICDSDNLCDDHNHVKAEVVQFVERVGAGDRSIVSDCPLPRPIVRSIVRKNLPAVINTVETFLYKMAHEKQAHTLEPFVSPFVSNASVHDAGIPTQIDLSPRMIAYFEVSILSNPEPLRRPQTTPSCVAVGLSTDNFNSSSRMPGWDMSSYGYHGDDGGLFHSHGEMIRVYGPKFNVGDTVGCGVNYQNGGIFFTLNGDFLGYAWLNEQVVLEGEKDLFPTIGVDSKDFIACNFGNERPFVFNFAKFVASDGNMPFK